MPQWGIAVKRCGVLMADDSHHPAGLPGKPVDCNCGATNFGYLTLGISESNEHARTGASDRRCKSFY